jgi:hypothetical protein
VRVTSGEQRLIERATRARKPEVRIHDGGKAAREAKHRTREMRGPAISFRPGRADYIISALTNFMSAARKSTGQCPEFLLSSTVPLGAAPTAIG